MPLNDHRSIYLPIKLRPHHDSKLDLVEGQYSVLNRDHNPVAISTPSGNTYDRRPVVIQLKKNIDPLQASLLSHNGRGMGTRAEGIALYDANVRKINSAIVLTEYLKRLAMLTQLSIAADGCIDSGNSSAIMWNLVSSLNDEFPTSDKVRFVTAEALMRSVLAVLIG
jgi:hypothetical protein